MDCVDLFAGLGGQSTGAVMAGNRVLWAANHWQVAVEFHAANHPETEHSCQDLQQADMSLIPDHDVGLTSPCCHGHSRARGADKPQHDNSRSTAWAVVTLAEVKRPQFLVIENVPDFTNWTVYSAWKLALETLGYTLSMHILDAADHGVAQNRIRMFMIASLSKNPIKLNLEKEEPINARSIIDLSAGNWSPIEKPGRSQATLNRIKNGRQDLKTDTFLIPYYGSGSGLTGRSLDRPIGTLTTKARWAVVNGDKMRMLTVDESRQFMSFPESTILPKQKHVAEHLLGNAVCPELEKRVLIALEKAA
jgi:DNA (cytosine-5)-methyltransferase 1